MPAPYRGFRWERADGVGTVVLDRPDKLNALTFEVYDELVRLFAEVGSDAAVKAVVIRGEGRAFCSGGDVNEIIGKLLDRPLEDRLAFTRTTCALVRNIRSCPQPVVASLHGAVAGAGAVIALTKVGLSGADMGAAWLLPRVVGLGRASGILLLGDAVPADEAHRIGLVHRVVPDGDLAAETAALARRLADGSEAGIRATKRMLREEEALGFDAALEAEAAGQAALLGGPDHREYHRAFNEKRKPVFRKPGA